MMSRELDISFTYGRYNYSGKPVGSTPPQLNNPYMPVFQSGDAEQQLHQWGLYSVERIAADLNSYHGSSEDNTNATTMTEQAQKPGLISWGNDPPHHYNNPIPGSNGKVNSYNENSKYYVKAPYISDKAPNDGHISWGKCIPHYYNDSSASMYPTANSKEFVNFYHGNSDKHMETPKLFRKALKVGHISRETDSLNFQYKFTAGMYSNEDRKGLVNSYNGSFEDQTEGKMTDKTLKQRPVSLGNGIPHYFYNLSTSMYPTAKGLKEGHISRETGLPHYHYKYTAGMHPAWKSKEFVNSVHDSSEDYMEGKMLESMIPVYLGMHMKKLA